MKRPKSRRVGLIDALLAAYDNGVIFLDKLCPHCLQHMGSFHHGVCGDCNKNCGCSFNPTSQGDHCTMHAGTNEYQRNT